ncbi:MAG: hypothetical protein U1E16_04785 [Hyphomicrobiales bacterium]
MSAGKELEQRIAQVNSDLQREQELLTDTDRAHPPRGRRDVLKASQGSDDDIRAEAAVALQTAADARWRVPRRPPTRPPPACPSFRALHAILRHRRAQEIRVARLDRELAETTAKRNDLLARHRRGRRRQADRRGGTCRTGREFEAHVSEAEVAVRAARAAEGDARAALDDDTCAAERTGCRPKCAR